MDQKKSAINKVKKLRGFKAAQQQEQESAAIFSEVVEVDQKIEAFLEVMKKFNITPERGVDYMTDQDIQIIVRQVASLIPDPKDGVTPVAGKDYPTYAQTRNFIERMIEALPKPKAGKKGKDGLDAVITDAHLTSVKEMVMADMNLESMRREVLNESTRNSKENTGLVQQLESQVEALAKELERVSAAMGRIANQDFGGGGSSSGGGGISVVTGQGEPTAKPSYLGQVYIDEMNDKIYMAGGLDLSDWFLIGGVDLANYKFLVGGTFGLDIGAGYNLLVQS